MGTTALEGKGWECSEDEWSPCGPEASTYSAERRKA